MDDPLHSATREFAGPTPAGPAADSALGVVEQVCPSEPGGADRLWMRGFHGALVDVDGAGAATLRQLALSRRGSGLESLDRLTALPAAHRSRGVPLAANGALQIGRAAGRPAHAAVVDAAVAEAEPLSDFIDRELARARFLLLPNQGRGYAVVKRVLDILLATVLLVVFAPVILALMVIIRLDSPGAAIFRQTRVTRGGREFVFLKFRTMYVDARDRFPELYDIHIASAGYDDTYYKLADDPRNTRVGRWLRRTTLDELPNLVNVLRGDLSMVGPRPDLPELVRGYRPEELACLFTKAGLTGVAQVAGRSLLTVRERLTLDLRYVAQQTLLLDLRILWRTVVVVISGRGAF